MVATTGMTFISAMQTTRSMSGQWLVNASMTGAFGTSRCRLLCGEGGRLLDLAPDNVAGDQHENAEQERHAPSPSHEGLVRKRVAQGQKDRRRQDLSRLHALQSEAREIAAPSERRVFEDHGARAGYLAGDRKTLDEAQDHQQDRRPDSNLLIGRKQSRPRWSRGPSERGRSRARSCGRKCPPDGRARTRRSALRCSPLRKSPERRRWRRWGCWMGRRFAERRARRRSHR